MNTKFKEEIFSTADITEMRDMFLAKKLVRSWKEDFVDEDSGEVTAIERHELILNKGTKLENSELSVVNFHLQAGDIQEVFISNQQRFGTTSSRMASVWQVTANYNNKKYNLFLYSNSIELAKMIATDYLEQKVEGIFSFIAIKELDFSTLIPENYGGEEEDLFEADYYKIEVSISEDEIVYEKTFIVKATDAENAKETIIKYFELNKEEGKESAELIFTIISAKTIPCDYVIDYDFSLQYIEDGIEA